MKIEKVTFDKNRKVLKLFLLASIMLFSVARLHSETLSGDKFLIEGEISDVEDGVVINLIRWDEFTGKKIASDTLRNGRFIFKEKAESDTDKLAISSQNDGFPPMSLKIWAAPGVEIKIKGNGKLHPLWDVKSPVPYQKEQNLYKNESRDLICVLAERNDLFSKIEAASSKEEALPHMKTIDSLTVIMDSLRIAQVLVDVEIMEKTKDISLIWLESMVSVAYLSNPRNDSKEYYGKLRKKAEKLYSRMSEENKNTLYGARIVSELFPPTVVEVGDDFVDASFFDINGNTKHLSDYLGKYSRPQGIRRVGCKLWRCWDSPLYNNIP